MQTFTPDGVSRASLKALSDFLKGISQARARALILGCDGALGRFSGFREQAKPHPELLPLLHRIKNHTDSRLVIVTGRSASSVADWLGLPDIDVWGCHGLERLKADGAIDKPEIPVDSLDAIAEATDLLFNEGLGQFAERKFASIAIHWQGKEAHAGHLTRRVLHAWSTVKGRKGILLVPFDGGIEIMAGARNKSHVVQTVLAEVGSDSAVAYLGGETTDEDAFAALRGHGLNILVREQYRRTLADVWLRPPAEVAAFLNFWIAGCKPSN
ncbi:MAG TPA: trehalose-phosphatase [Terracidiphilus sp.]